MLHHHASQLVLGREVLDLAVAQLAHERGLAGPVRAQDAVPPATEQAETGVGEQQQRAIGEREQCVAQELALFGRAGRSTSVLRFVDRLEVRTHTLRELRRVGAAGWEPGVDEGPEAPLPGLRVGEAASIDEVRDEARGELEHPFQKWVPGSMGPVGSTRGDDSQVLGEECEQGGEDFGSLGLNVARSGRRAIFGCAGLL